MTTLINLSQPIRTGNFLPLQSVQLAVSNSGGTGSASKTFTIVPGGSNATSFKWTNTGTKGAYVATGVTTATAVASSGTVIPAATAIIVAATCDYVGAGCVLIQDYFPGTDTIAAICGGTDTTTLEVSIGYGQ